MVSLNAYRDLRRTDKGRATAYIYSCTAQSPERVQDHAALHRPNRLYS